MKTLRAERHWHIHRTAGAQQQETDVRKGEGQIVGVYGVLLRHDSGEGCGDQVIRVLANQCNELDFTLMALRDR